VIALITGGGGFLGSAIIRQLHQRGNCRLRSFSRQRYPHLDSLGVEQFTGDLTDRDALMRAAPGCDLIFHVAAKAGVWGPYREYHAANVAGTENILGVCRDLKIPRLVYTSSPSVVHGKGHIQGGDESLPYPRHFETAYPQTKAIAEQMVLQANSSELLTVALRPHLIWGPGDPHLIPRLLARARAGKLKRIGREDHLVDTVYVENAAEAHLLAADRLIPGSPVSGKVYFITNGEPVPLWSFIDRILQTENLPPVTRTVPFWLAHLAGGILECIYRVLRLKGEPPMTRFVARQLSTAHWYRLDAARRDLGYEPRISIEEGLRRLRDSTGTN
jgi:nucleoside-diphosphate-sugar epimerase